MTEQETKELFKHVIRYLNTHQLSYTSKESKFYVEGEGKLYPFTEPYYVSSYELKHKPYEDEITIWSDLVYDHLKNKGILK
jgi:hypothetical protein